LISWRFRSCYEHDNDTNTNTGDTVVSHHRRSEATLAHGSITTRANDNDNDTNTGDTVVSHRQRRTAQWRSLTARAHRHGSGREHAVHQQHTRGVVTVSSKREPFSWHDALCTSELRKPQCRQLNAITMTSRKNGMRVISTFVLPFSSQETQ
jgi:hypothetical protein